MKYAKILLSFVAWLVLAGMAADKLQLNYGVSPVVTAMTLFVVTLMIAKLSRDRGDDKNGRHLAVVDVSIWVREIIKRFWKENLFMNYAFSEDEYVVGGAAVLIPQPGAKATVVKNRSSYPATAVRRADTTVMYGLDEYTTDPTHIPDVEMDVISYDKRASIIDDHFGGIIETVADDMLIKWATNIPAANIIGTSGADTAALEDGQTGMRKAMVWQDLRDAGKRMTKQNVSKNGRVALIEENMYQQLVDSLAATQYKDFSKEYNASTGVLGTLFNFNIMTRSSVISAAAALDAGILDVNALDAAMAATDNVGALCWQTNVLSRALGTTKLYQDLGNPLYYGDIHSCSLRMGGRIRRADNAGLVAIMQSAAAGN